MGTGRWNKFEPAARVGVATLPVLEVAFNDCLYRTDAPASGSLFLVDS